MTLAKTFSAFVNENNGYTRQEVVDIWNILDSVNMSLYINSEENEFEEYLFELLQSNGFYVGSPIALYTGYLRLMDQYESHLIDEPELWSKFTDMVDNNLFESRK